MTKWNLLKSTMIINLLVLVNTTNELKVVFFFSSNQMLAEQLSKSRSLVHDHWWLPESSCCCVIVAFVLFSMRSWIKAMLLWILAILSQWQIYVTRGAIPRRMSFSSGSRVPVSHGQFQMKFYHYNTLQTTVVGLLQGFTCYSGLIAGTVHPAALFRCLSLTPSSVRGQSPAEGQMVSFLPLGLSLSRVALFPPTACFLEVFTVLVMLEFNLCEWNIYYLYISNERAMDHHVWLPTCFGKPVKK